MLFSIRDQECFAVRAEMFSLRLIREVPGSRAELDSVKRLTALGLSYFYSGHAW